MMHIIGITGQLGNQLFRLAHHLANGIRYDYPMHSWGFSYNNLFPELSKHPLVKISETNTKLQQKMVKATAKVVDQEITKHLLSVVGISTLTESFTFTEENSQFLNQVRNNHIIATNWLFRDYNSFTTMAPNLRSLLTLAASNRLDAEKRIKSIRSNSNNLIVGIHYRRGDYQTWQNGKYYFDENTFTKIMKHMQALYAHKTVEFIIFSNENVDKFFFKGLSTHFEIQPFAIDLAAMTLCDYLIGPPSTFSGWASFFGEVPLYIMRKASHMPSISDFSIFAG